MLVGSLSSLSRLFEQAGRRKKSWLCYLKFLRAKTAKRRALVRNYNICQVKCSQKENCEIANSINHLSLQRVLYIYHWLL